MNKTVTKMKINKIVTALLLVMVIGLVFVGCSKDDAIWLQTGQTLEIVDNTLGEGQPHNWRFTYSYKNSVVNEEKGYVYVLPVSEDNPTVRYFASLKQGSSSSKFVEITNVKNGAKLTIANFMPDFADLWAQGMTFVDGTKDVNTSVHYSSVVTTTKYCYNATKHNNMKIWGDKYLAVTITSPVFSATPVSFSVDIKDFHVSSLILSQVGDSWKVV